MKRLTTVEIHPGEINFSAGHFTIFSATEREPVHGHNYTLNLALTTLIDDEGLMFDYRFYKKKLRDICERLNCRMLLPEFSKYLSIEKKSSTIEAIFNQQIFHFPIDDVVILPIHNTTVEELSFWFLQQLLHDQISLKKHCIQKILLKVFSAPGQSGSATWPET